MKPSAFAPISAVTKFFHSAPFNFLFKIFFFRHLSKTVKINTHETRILHLAFYKHDTITDILREYVQRSVLWEQCYEENIWT